MKSRNVLLSLLLVCCLMAWAMWQSRQQRTREALERHPDQLRFTPTALCNLRCLKLQPADAETILADGLVLYHKSNRRARPCPIWVVQGSSRSGLTCRLRIEQCGNRLVVIRAEKPGAAAPCDCTESEAVPKGL